MTNHEKPGRNEQLFHLSVQLSNEFTRDQTKYNYAYKETLNF